MYRMPQPVGGFSPNQDFIQDQGYKMPQPVGGFNSYTNNTNYGDDDIESEYEYITDDEGDFVEDENGALYTLEEAQNRGLIAPANGERGIGKTLLIGSVLLGGSWMLRKQLKKKKRVKKQNHNNNKIQQTNNNNTDNKPQLYPFFKTNPVKTQTTQNYQYPSQTPNVYGQNMYGQPPNYQQNPYGTPLYPNYNSYNGYSGYNCYNNINRSVPSW